jgi:signal transduction histidine kinase
MSAVEVKVYNILLIFEHFAQFYAELLIDVTSHELRQPVSAILNCSSLVRSNLDSLRTLIQQSTSSNAPFVATPELLLAMDEDLDALDAIYQVPIFHQIVNDSLMFL